jgi:hypothetical protein
MWTKVLNIVLGLAVVLSPAFFDAGGTIANNNYVVGPLVITFSVVALWDINDAVRVANVVPGGWLISSAFILDSVPAGMMLFNIIAGVLIFILSLIPTKTHGQYGGGWSSLFQKDPLHLQKAKAQES